MKHLKTMLIYCLSLAIIITFTPAAFAADSAVDQGSLKKDGGTYKIKFEGGVEQSDAYNPDAESFEDKGLLDNLGEWH